MNVPVQREAAALGHECFFWKNWVRKVKRMGIMATSPKFPMTAALTLVLRLCQTVSRVRLSTPLVFVEHSKLINEVIGYDGAGRMTSATLTMPSHVLLRYFYINSGAHRFSTGNSPSRWTKMQTHYANVYFKVFAILKIEFSNELVLPGLVLS